MGLIPRCDLSRTVLATQRPTWFLRVASGFDVQACCSIRPWEDGARAVNFKDQMHHLQRCLEYLRSSCQCPSKEMAVGQIDLWLEWVHSATTLPLSFQWLPDLLCNLLILNHSRNALHSKKGKLTQQFKTDSKHIQWQRLPWIALDCLQQRLPWIREPLGAWRAILSPCSNAIPGGLA